MDKGRKWGDTFIDRKRHLLKKEKKLIKVQNGETNVKNVKTEKERRQKGRTKTTNVKIGEERKIYQDIYVSTK